jgi:secreted trypsin-like serine protease
MIRRLMAILRHWLLSTAVLLALAGCGGAPAQLSAVSQAIVGGTDDADDPAVVALLAAGYCACSGTLVSPTAVLTAGHCADLLGPAVQYEVAFGSDVAHPSQKVAVSEQVAHPQYTTMGAPFDAALLRLARPVTNVTPVAVGTSALTAADVGVTVRHVGIGVADEAAGTGRGVKRQVSYPITQVEPQLVWSGGPGQQTCLGDSGGPALMTRGGGEELVGITSDGPNCHDPGWDTRADTVADWVSTTVAAWAPDAGPAPTPPPKGCSTAGGGAGLWVLALVLAARLSERAASAEARRAVGWRPPRGPPAA